jgi:GNAT superfamily N-acetyltransferase
MPVSIQAARGRADLEGILALQAANLRDTLDPAVALREGFVTARYDLELMEAMHRETPSIVALDGEAVVGYALVTTRGVGGRHPLLADLVAQIDRSHWRGAPVRELDYLVCGQLCVAASHRGQGLVDALYGEFRRTMSPHYEAVVTDVARDNPRSLRAHQRCGFVAYGTLVYGGALWDLVIQDWRDHDGRAG